MNAKLTAIIDALGQREELQPLLPKQTWNAELQEQIEELNSLGSSTENLTLIAALHLRNDSLDISHSYAQQIEHDITGAYWHGIMHRMEGDYSNAKYWFWQARKHPVMQRVKEKVAEWLEQNGQATDNRSDEIVQSFQHGGWNSESFTDLVQISPKLNEETRQILVHIQAIEIATLFQYTLAAVDNNF